MLPELYSNQFNQEYKIIYSYWIIQLCHNQLSIICQLLFESSFLNRLIQHLLLLLPKSFSLQFLRSFWLIPFFEVRIVLSKDYRLIQFLHFIRIHHKFHPSINWVGNWLLLWFFEFPLTSVISANSFIIIYFEFFLIYSYIQIFSNKLNP